MKFELKKYNRGTPKDYRNVTDDELINDLRQVANKLQKNSVTHSEYDQQGKFNSHIFGRRFGGWLNALEKAGLQKTRNYNITDEEAFQNLENIWIKLGRQPIREELCAPLSKYSGAFYEYRFGTWQKALELIPKPIAIQSPARFAEKTAQTREVYRGTPTEDKPFFTEYGGTTMRNGFNNTIQGRFWDEF